VEAARDARIAQVAEVARGERDFVDDAIRRERQTLAGDVAVVVVRRDLGRLAAHERESPVLKLDAVERLAGDVQLLEKHAIRRLSVAHAAQIPARLKRVTVGRRRGERVLRRAIESEAQLQSLMVIAPVLRVCAELILEHAIAQSECRGLQLDARRCFR